MMHGGAATGAAAFWQRRVLLLLLLLCARVGGGLLFQRQARLVAPALLKALRCRYLVHHGLALLLLPHRMGGLAQLHAGHALHRLQQLCLAVQEQAHLLVQPAGTRVAVPVGGGLSLRQPTQSASTGGASRRSLHHHHCTHRCLSFCSLRSSLPIVRCVTFCCCRLVDVLGGAAAASRGSSAAAAAAARARAEGHPMCVGAAMPGERARDCRMRAWHGRSAGKQRSAASAAAATVVVGIAVQPAACPGAVVDAASRGQVSGQLQPVRQQPAGAREKQQHGVGLSWGAAGRDGRGRGGVEQWAG